MLGVDDALAVPVWLVVWEGVPVGLGVALEVCDTLGVAQLLAVGVVVLVTELVCVRLALPLELPVCDLDLDCDVVSL